MEKAKEVKFRKTASENIASIAQYIEEKGYPVTAEKFASRLFEFAFTLGSFPEKYPLCRNKILALNKFRCAVFNNHLFLFTD